VAGLLLAFAVVDYLVLPRLAGTEKSLHLLAEIRPGWVVAGVVFEAASLVCYSLFTRSLLRDSGVSFSRMLRSDLTGFGVGHVVPGGGAGATALRFRLLVTSGATATQVTAAIAAEGAGTWLALALVLWVTLIPAMFVLGASSLLLTLFLVGAGVLISTLLGFGVPGGIAVLGVVSWRLIQYWAPIPVAGLCYLSLRTPGWRQRVGSTPGPSKHPADLS
jgi:uncharacterized membrane protein YbhN (UPF0104 family)